MLREASPTEAETETGTWQYRTPLSDVRDISLFINNHSIICVIPNQHNHPNNYWRGIYSRHCEGWECLSSQFQFCVQLCDRNNTNGFSKQCQTNTWPQHVRNAEKGGELLSFVFVKKQQSFPQGISLLVSAKLKSVISWISWTGFQFGKLFFWLRCGQNTFGFLGNLSDLFFILQPI